MEQKNSSLDFEFFIFNPSIHGHYVDDFLLKASNAHKQPPKSEEWFYWKFFKNPYGDSILACVAIDNELIGCVAYGKQPFVINGEVFPGVMSFETFIDPNYQGKGLFSKLLKYAEEEVVRQGIKIMLNFPNSQSLPGFLKKNWQPLNISTYYLRPRLRFNLLIKFTNIRQPFVSFSNNFQAIKDALPETFKYTSKASVEALITKEYLAYRFFSFPHGNYQVYQNNDNFAIGRLGNRGGLKELQVLLINTPNLNSHTVSKIINGLCRGTKADFVSYPSSSNSVLTTILKKLFFVRVPNKANVCYKILDAHLNPNMEILELAGINFHTY